MSFTPTNFTPTTNFGKRLMLAIRKGRMSNFKHEQEVNRLARRGLSRMSTNAYLLLHGMKRLHGVGETKEMMK